MQIADNRVIAGGDVVQWRIFDYIATVTHRILNAFNRVACCAGEARLRRRRMEILPYRFVHHTVEQNRWVVATTAPLRGLDAVHLLHIDN